MIEEQSKHKKLDGYLSEKRHQRLFKPFLRPSQLYYGWAGAGMKNHDGHLGILEEAMRQTPLANPQKPIESFHRQTHYQTKRMSWWTNKSLFHCELMHDVPMVSFLFPSFYKHYFSFKQICWCILLPNSSHLLDLGLAIVNFNQLVNQLKF